MCNRYTTPDAAAVEREWHIGRSDRPDWPRMVFPRAQGPFLRRHRAAAAYERELVVGQWGLIPWFAKAAKLPYSTNNARSEELAQKATYKHPWTRGPAGNDASLQRSVTREKTMPFWPPDTSCTCRLKHATQHAGQAKHATGHRSARSPSAPNVIP
jgi:hypothetical protein